MTNLKKDLNAKVGECLYDCLSNCAIAVAVAILGNDWDWRAYYDLDIEGGFLIENTDDGVTRYSLVDYDLEPLRILDKLRKELAND